MNRQGFYYDQTRCIGCNVCQIACKDAHDLEPGIVYRRVSTWESEGKDTQVLCMHYSGACNHCNDAECLKYCPVHAITKRKDGTIFQDVSKCIGCGTCTWVCPYGAPVLSRFHGTAVKCDGCAERRAQGKQPVCVEACLTHCLQYGDLKELSDGHPVTRDLPFLPSSTLTDPSLWIQPRYTEDAKEEVLEECSVVEQETPMIVDGSGKKCVILGGGIAGVTAAETVRKYSPDIAITILSGEAELPYSRPLLSKTYLKSLDATKILLKPENWYAENRIQLERKAKIVSLDPEQKRVVLEDGRSFDYDICIYALGAKAWIPPMEGYPMEGIYPVRCAKDTEEIHTSLLTAKQVIVLGGGVIGLEMAEELHHMGLPVTILEAAPRLMGRLLDEESSAVLKARLKACGMQVEEGASVERVQAGSDGRLEQVVLKDGRIFPADAMVVSCGIRANIAIAQQAGLECERGVAVNEYLETSAPSIYAAGDCISLNHANPGLWGFSKETAEIAARNAVFSLAQEEGSGYHAGASEVMMRTGGVSLFSAGCLEEGEGITVTYEPLINTEEVQMQEFAALPRNASVFLVNHRPGETFSYRKYYWKEEQLVGAVLMGDLTELAEVKKRLEEA